jgi:hypothetical protein
MDIKEINKLDITIRELRKLADEIMTEGGQIEAVKRNTKRILASIKMLEINICDINDLNK